MFSSFRHDSLDFLYSGVILGYMTYKKLAELILAMPPEIQEFDVSILDANIDEIIPMHRLAKIVEDGDFSDVLEVGHPVIVINA